MDERSDPRFACDAMLCGLARWLRAAGYDAWWQEGVAERDLIRVAQHDGRTLLSSDTQLFQRNVIRDGTLPALQLPHNLGTQEQLAFVLKKLGLPLREPRCMACGGGLMAVPREQVRDRVPPRTFAWADRFWECDRCRRIFWHGTHWQRIEQRLREAAGESPCTPPAAG
jgi:uncharacterized protein with PIN domain